MLLFCLYTFLFRFRPEPAKIESRANLDKKKEWWPPRKTRAFMALAPAGDEDREMYKKCVKDLMKRNRVSHLTLFQYCRHVGFIYR